MVAMNVKDIEIVEGDLLDQQTEAIVNAWNRNIIPWWLLWPHGVSGAIKKRGGLEPFKAIGRTGPLPLGQARATTAGRLPFRYIIHVASIDMTWTASEESIRNSVINAMKLAGDLNLSSIAFPVIGAGSGGFNEKNAEKIMMTTLEEIESEVRVVLVRFKN